MHLTKQQVFHVDPKAILQIIFMRNLELAEVAAIFVILKEVNKTILIMIKWLSITVQTLGYQISSW